MNDCRFLPIAQLPASLAYHKPITMYELKNCSGGRRGDRRNLRSENDQCASTRVVILCPKQSPWTLLA
jgi:hypothetical protein